MTLPNIVVDGVPYGPIQEGAPRIGVGITTHNRPDAFQKTFHEIKRRTPGAKIVVVDDASDIPVQEATYRFEKNVGIARAKNKCLELLDDCDHIFLFDDDTYPIVDEWWKPYVESPEPHLAFSWNLIDVYRDSKHAAFHASGGCMLYVEKHVLQAVGGMETCFGRWGWEHVNWSDRIHNAGFTTWRYADVVNSRDLFHPMDAGKEVKSTATKADFEHNQGPARELYMSKRYDSHYVEYRDLEDVVITTLFTRVKDPQRGTRMKSDPTLVKHLANSLKGKKLIVLHDALENPHLAPNVEFVKVETGINPYFQRWQSIFQFLRSHPNIGRVWCVDGTDVEMLRDPFPEMEDGVLYTGFENATLRNAWMLKNHPDSKLQEFMRENPNMQLLNAGLLGGSRELVMRFAQKVTQFWYDDHIDEIQGWERGRAGVGDMGAFNYVARKLFADVISWGTHVNTIFKAEERNEFSWWKHK